MNRIDRFTVKYRVDPESGCWMWQAAKLRKGYGYFYIPGQTTKAHRASWILHVGPIPDGLCVLHRCDTPSCVNPEHLFLGTQDENVADRNRKNRQARQRGERNGRAAITEEQVRAIRLERDTQSAIGARYGIAQTTVGQIRSGRRWGHLQ